MQNHIFNKVISIILLLIFAGHINLFHSVLNEYVVCSGVDGHLAVENINECEECDDNQLYFNDINIDVPNCEDVPLSQICFDDQQIITKNIISIDSTIINSNKINYGYQDRRNYFPYIINLSNNPTLKEYTTVSLLI